MNFGRGKLFLGVPVVAALILSACGGGGGSDRKRIAKKRPNSQKLVFASDQGTRQCLADLGAARVKYNFLPEREFGGGCSALRSVQLLDIGIPVTNLGAMQCPLARNFAAWTRFAVAPAGRRILGSEVMKIETMGTYSCRNIVGASSGKLSQHALSNAVDVSAFILADGRRVAVKGGWKDGTPSERNFLRTVHTSACKRFGIVLSPDYNSAHHDHFHFDMGKGPFCR